MSDEPGSPRHQEDSTLSIVIGFILTMLATFYVLYISGTLG